MVRMVDTAMVRGDALYIGIVIGSALLMVALHEVIVGMVVVALHGRLLGTLADIGPNHVVNSDWKSKQMYIQETNRKCHTPTHQSKCKTR